MSAGFRSFSSFWWGPDGLGRPTKTYPADILLQKTGIERSEYHDILVIKNDIESSVLGSTFLRGAPSAILEANIFSLSHRSVGYGMIYRMKISGIEQVYYNSISVSKRATKLRDRKSPYASVIKESSVVSIGITEIDDESDRKSREYPDVVESAREKSKVSIEDYNDLL